MGIVIRFPRRRRHTRASATGLMPKTPGSTGSAHFSDKISEYSAGMRPRIFQFETTRGSTPAISEVAVVPPRAKMRLSTDAIMPLTNPRYVELSSLHGMEVETPRIGRFNLSMGDYSRDKTAFRLQVLRDALDMTQAVIGRPVDCSSSRWSNFESLQQKHNLDIDVACRICDRYGVTLDWLYRGIMLRVDDALKPLLDASEQKLRAAHASSAKPPRLRKRTAGVDKTRRETHLK